MNWSAPWSVDVASTIPEAGCAWAPEAIYDESTRDYFVYWTTISPHNGVREARIFSTHTNDFRSFTPPELFIERNGSGVTEVVSSAIALGLAPSANPINRCKADCQECGSF